MLVTVPVVMPMICAYNVEVDLDAELEVDLDVELEVDLDVE